MTTDIWISLMPRYAYEVNKDGVVRALDGSYVEPLETGSYWLQCAVESHSTLWTGDDLVEHYEAMLSIMNEDSVDGKL